MLDKTKVVDLDRLPRQLFIGGEWVDAVDGGRISIVNPFNNEELFEIAEAREADVDRAVAAARAAFPAWAGIALVRAFVILEVLYRREREKLFPDDD